MKPVTVVRWLLENPRLRSPWWRWLQTVPEPLRSTASRARTAFLLFQIPVALLLVVAHALAKHFGAFRSEPLVEAWVVGAGILALLWPVSLWRVGTAALRAASTATEKLAFQLRAYAALFFLLAAVSIISLAILVGLIALASGQSATVGHMWPNPSLQATAFGRA